MPSKKRASRLRSRRRQQCARKLRPAPSLCSTCAASAWPATCGCAQQPDSGPARDLPGRRSFIEVKLRSSPASTPEAPAITWTSRGLRRRVVRPARHPNCSRQLLMVAELEPLLQVARCFRDEDLCAPIRQPSSPKLDSQGELFLEQERSFCLSTKRLDRRDLEDSEGKSSMPLPFPASLQRRRDSLRHRTAPTPDYGLGAGGCERHCHATSASRVSPGACAAVGPWKCIAIPGG